MKYLTLTQLLGKPTNARGVLDARERIPAWRPVSRILSNQLPSGGWEAGTDWYIPKHRTTVWQLIVLSQTGIDPHLPAVRKMCEYAFKFQSRPGGFVADRHDPEESDWGATAGCLNGNVIAALCRLGYSEDKRIARAVNHLVKAQEADGGWGCRGVTSHRNAKHSCFMGAVCALDGLNEYSKNATSPKIRESVALACEYILMHRLFKADHHGWKTINKDWLLLRAPYLWNYDIVRGLLALRNAGIDDDPRMKDALTVLKSKKTRSGRWIREKNWMGNSYSTFGRRGREDKWITLNALRALNRTGTK